MLIKKVLLPIIRATATLTIAIYCIAFTDVDYAHAQSDQLLVDELVHGEALAKENCSQCHNINLSGDSPNKAAPPFRKLDERRPIDTIARMLLDKESPEHTDMPRFTLTVSQAWDIAEWIDWLQPVAHGKRLVEENCARCHAVGLDDESSFQAAPPFRNLSMFYPIDALEGAFAERIETGHPSMPVFEVTITQLRDMLAYIKTIQNP